MKLGSRERLVASFKIRSPYPKKEPSEVPDEEKAVRPLTTSSSLKYCNVNSFNSRNSTDISNRVPQFLMFSVHTMQVRNAHLEKLLQFSRGIFQFTTYIQGYKMFYCCTNHPTSQSTTCKLLSSKGQWDSNPLRPSILYIVTITTKTEEFWPFSLTALVTKKLPTDKTSEIAYDACRSALLPVRSRLVFTYFTPTNQTVLSFRFFICDSDSAEDLRKTSCVVINLQTPNVNYSWRTAPLTSKIAFYIFIQQI